MGPRLDPLLDEPVLFAHRGGRAHAPENTTAAFALAMRLGATGLESDVWLTRDGHTVLDHDGTVRRGLRRHPIATLDRADLPPHIPTLDELYEICGTSVDVSLDLKDPAAAATAVRTANARAPEAAARLWLVHPDWEVLARLRAEVPGVRLMHSTGLGAMTGGPERHAARLREAGIDAVNLRHGDWTGGLTTLFHRFGRICMAWDAQHARIIRDLLHMGIDGVFSDYVDRLVDARASMG